MKEPKHVFQCYCLLVTLHTTEEIAREVRNGNKPTYEQKGTERNSAYMHHSSAFALVGG